MPIPKPGAGQSQRQYISSCMANPTMRREYGDQKRRAAVCFDTWRRRNKTAGMDFEELWEEIRGEYEPEARVMKGDPKMADATKTTKTTKTTETTNADSKVVINVNMAAEGSQMADHGGDSLDAIGDGQSCVRCAYEFAKVLEQDEFTYILGPVLVPEKEDKQGDVIGHDDVEKAAHDFLEDDGRAGLLHQLMLGKRDAAIVESYVLRSAGSIGGRKLKRGSWMVGMRIYAQKLRKAIKDGELRGFSIGGGATAVSE